MHGACCPMGVLGWFVAVNGIGAEGATSLSVALKCCPELRTLNLSGELIDICEPCERGGAWLTHMGKLRLVCVSVSVSVCVYVRVHGMCVIL